MNTPTPTHTVHANLGLTWTRTVWNHGPFTLTLEKIEGEDEHLDWKTSTADHKLPNIEPTKYHWEEGESTYGVSWSGQGASSVDEAWDYAQAMMMACEAAARFTAIRNTHQ